MAQDKDVRATGGAERVAELLDERAPDIPRLRAALRLVTGGQGRAISDLVRETALSRRLLLDLLRRMGSDLAWDGEMVRFAGEPAGYAPLITTGPAGAARAGGEPADVAVEQMSRILDRAPSALRSLDHVPATAETVLRRAEYIAREFDLARTRLLFAGDHDCTSLAFGVLGLAPASVTVADIDERLLGFIGAEAEAAGAPVVPLFADLRTGLPDGARGAHDVVFTDPPYTADGIGLFAARGVEALAEPVNGRILLAYGYSESTPALGLSVQRVLGELELLFEAILPGFNRYQGAEAIGSAADLYRLRPTRRTAAIVQRRAGRYAHTMYTQGSQAVEGGRGAASGGTGGPVSDGDAVCRAVLDRFGGLRGGGAALLAGAGWAVPGTEATAAQGTAPAKLPGTVPVERFLTGATLPPGGQGTTFADLRPLFGWSLIRAGLAAGSDRVIVVAPMDAYGLRSDAEQSLLREALAPKYQIDHLLRPFDHTDAAVIVLHRPQPGAPAAGAPAGAAASRGEASRRAASGGQAPRGEAPGREASGGAASGGEQGVAGYVWQRPRGRVGNTWREGLIAAVRNQGATLTKNEARAIIGQADIPDGVTGHRLIDLPAAALLRLRAAIAGTEALIS